MTAPAAFCGVFGHEPSYGVVPLGGFSPGAAERRIGTLYLKRSTSRA